MNILVRNEECVSECVLITDSEEVDDILEHPEVKNLVGGRRVLYSRTFVPNHSNYPTMVDLELRS